MLNLFPNLIVLQTFAPTIIRLAAASIVGYMAYSEYKHRSQIAHTDLPVIGRQSWVAGFSILICSLTALMLALGYYTQLGALLTAIISVKGIVWGDRLGAISPYSRSTYFLLLAISLALLLSGAGQFAVDIQQL